MAGGPDSGYPYGGSIMAPPILALHPARALRPGSTVAIVAPSGPFDRAAFEEGVARLATRYEVRHAPGIFERRGYFAGEDARRLQELRLAIADREVDAIVAARGGYGATRLLDGVDLEEVRAASKLLVGFSDVTALHALWARAGLRSIHGPMVSRLGRATGAAFARWVSAVEGAVPTPVTGLSSIEPGRARGPLVGGNLAVLAALVGTPHAPPLDGAILFLEDVGERPYRIDRMLTTLRQAGWLGRVAGVVLGAFTESAAGPDGVAVESVLAERLSGLGVPVAAGLPCGHVDDNLELPLGAPATLDADEGTLVFEGSAVEPAGGPS